MRSGDDRAFDELYSRYGAPILGYVNRIVGDHGRAEDIAQDVFVSALRAMRSSDRAIAFKPWIYEIARNACIDEFRRLQRCPEISADGDETVAQRRDLAAAAPPPEADLERRQQLEHLRGAFRGLSQGQHKVLLLRELEGRSYMQIAERTGMSLPMVESTLFRARRRLSEEYGEIASGRRCEQVHHVLENGGVDAFEALRLRERRRFVRHVAHCQPCRRQALLAGIDESSLRVPSLAEKIAALFPLPLLPWRRALGEGRVSRLVRSLHRAVPDFGDPAAAAGAGQAAVVVAAAVMAVGGIAYGPNSPGPHHAGAVPASQVQLSRALGSSPYGSVAGPASATQSNPSATSRSHHPGSGARGPGHPRSTAKISHSAPAGPSLGSKGNTTSNPSLPGPLRRLPGQLPSLPGQVTKTLKSDVHSLVHHTNSVTKKVTRLLPPHLPGPLTHQLRAPLSVGGLAATSPAGITSQL